MFNLKGRDQIARKSRGVEYSRGKAMVTRSGDQTKQAEVRSYAVGVAAKWGIVVKTLEAVNKWISLHKAASPSASRPASGRAGRSVPQQLGTKYLKVEDKTGIYRSMVKQPAAWPQADFTPSMGSPFGDVVSPPRTRSAGRKTNARQQPPSSAGASGGRTTRQRAGKVAQSPSSPRKTTPRSRKPLTTLVTGGQLNVHFQMAKVPPASEVIPKAKTMKKVNVTMKKVKRQLDFDDILPSPPSTGKKVMKPTKKIVILRELQDRLDGISRENSPVKEQPQSRKQTRGGRTRRASSSSPKARPVTVARLARQLKKELQQNSDQITPMSLRNGKVKFAAH